MRSSALIFLQLVVAASAQTAQLPTWPSPVYDQMEEIMTQDDGYRSQGFFDGVATCGFSSSREPGRMSAAEWIRTAFHDMATADVSTGVGGLDASLIFETDRAENPGAGLPSSFGFFSAFLGARASLADLTALGVQVATRMCRGPLVPYRAGRIDAKAAGPLGVPEPQESISNFTQKFARVGFSAEEMIALVACGHTLGGVHSKDFPAIVPNGSQPDTSAHFDNTRVQFDNAIVTEYLENNSSNPLVVGPAKTNSDQRIFSSDGNVTMQGLVDPQTFANRCAMLFAKMIDTVPKEVQLTQVLVPYEVKPSEIRLTVADTTSLNFTGEIRVRTTIRQTANISKLEIIYSGNDNTSQTVSTSLLNEGTFSLDESFGWYSFATKVPSSTAVKSYIVKITLTNGDIETYDNNGRAFPIQNLIFFQPSFSCGGTFVDVNTPVDTTLVAAVHQSRLSLPNPTVKVTARKTRASTPGIPELFETDYTMEPWTGADAPPIPKEYAWFKVSYASNYLAQQQQTWDMISGSGDDAAVDDFRQLPFPGNVCGKS